MNSSSPTPSPSGRALTGRQQVLVCAGLLLLCAMHFSAPLIITHDSAHYLSYIPILVGKQPWTEWDVVRGIVFPAWLHLCRELFGANAQGALVASFLCFIGTLVMAFRLVLPRVEAGRARMVALGVVLLLLALDPTVFGYFHTLLTEYWAVVLFVASVLVASRYFDALLGEAPPAWGGRYLAGLVGLAVVAFHVKQPYAGVALFPLVVVLVLNGLLRRTWAAWRLAVGGMVLAVGAILGSSALWNLFLPDAGKANVYERSTHGLLSELVIRSTFYLAPGASVADVGKEPALLELLPEAVREELAGLATAPEAVRKCSRVWVAREPEGPAFAHILVHCSRGYLELDDALRAYVRFASAHPGAILKGYFAAFSELLDGRNGRFKVAENEVIAHRTFRVGPQLSNMFHLEEEVRPYALEYDEPNLHPGGLPLLLGRLGGFSLFMLETLGWLSGPLALLVLAVCWRLGRQGDPRRVARALRYLGPLAIGAGSAFLFLATLVILGATYDRYSFPTYPIMGLTLAIGVGLLLDREAQRELVRGLYPGWGGQEAPVAQAREA